MAGVAPEVPRALAGRYRLVRLLARGGMAEVWEGRDEVLSRPVAVKILMAHLATDPFLRERFRREAITAARLVHPGIVAIFDAGVEVVGEDGTAPGARLSGSWSRDERERLEMAWPDEPSTAFIIMELVPGETLRDLMARSGPLAPDLAVAIAAQVTEGLAYAHAQGLVHRDIKPANVLLGTEGVDLVRVKVADFGIAKATATANIDLTSTGTLLGTPKYLSPEQVQGEEPDARADLYSLGVVLFEMLAGQAPFRGSTEMATALAHVQQPAPSLEALRPGLPPALYQLVDALLVKDPGKRVPSALVLGGALTSVRRQLGVAPGDTGTHIQLTPAPTSAGVAPDGTRRTSSSGPVLPAPSIGRTSVLAGTGPSAGGKGRPEARPDGTAVLGGNTEVALVTKSKPAGTDRKEARRRRHRRTGRAASVVVGLLLLSGAVVLSALLHNGGGVGDARGTQSTVAGNTVPPTATPPNAISIASVREVAQGGNHANDNLGTLANVITGQSPAWTSDKYFAPDFGGYGGFGLAVQLKSTVKLSQLEVETTMGGWSAQVYVGSSYGAALGHWGQPVSSSSNLSGDHTFSLSGRSGRWVLFWMLSTGPSDQAVVSRLIIT